MSASDNRAIPGLVTGAIGDPHLLGRTKVDGLDFLRNVPKPPRQRSQIPWRTTWVRHRRRNPLTYRHQQVAAATGSASATDIVLLGDDSRASQPEGSRTSDAFRDGLGVPDVRSHSFRKSVATMIDDAGLSARVGADQLGYAKVSMTQDRHMRRGKVHTEVAALLDRSITGE